MIEMIAAGISAGASIGSLYSQYKARGYVQQAGVYQQLGIIQQGQAQAAAAEYNARVSLENADIALEQGRYSADLQQRDAQRAYGSVQAAYGASGVTADSGSVVDVLMESTMNATRDNLAIMHNAELESRSYKAQAAMQQQEAQNARTSMLLGVMAAQNSTAGGMNSNMGGMFGTIGNAATNAYSAFRRM
jgi:hypothetical protein